MSRAAFRVTVQTKSCGQKNLTLRKWKWTDATVTFKRGAKLTHILELNSHAGSPWLWILLRCVCVAFIKCTDYIFMQYMVSYSTPPEFDCSFLYLLWSSLLMKYHSLLLIFCCMFQHMTSTLPQSSPGKESFMYRISWKILLGDLSFYRNQKIYQVERGLGGYIQMDGRKRCPLWNERKP